jgi:hypothetical protein
MHVPGTPAAVTAIAALRRRKASEARASRGGRAIESPRPAGTGRTHWSATIGSGGTGANIGDAASGVGSDSAAVSDGSVTDAGSTESSVSSGDAWVISLPPATVGNGSSASAESRPGNTGDTSVEIGGIWDSYGNGGGGGGSVPVGTRTRGDLTGAGNSTRAWTVVQRNGDERLFVSSDSTVLTTEVNRHRRCRQFHQRDRSQRDLGCL